MHVDYKLTAVQYYLVEDITQKEVCKIVGNYTQLDGGLFDIFECNTINK